MRRLINQAGAREAGEAESIHRAKEAIIGVIPAPHVTQFLIGKAPGLIHYAGMYRATCCPESVMRETTGHWGCRLVFSSTVSRPGVNPKE